jgi:hypothetical protein
MRLNFIACVLAVAVLTGMAAAQNDCYGTDIGDRVCCSTDGEEVYSCPNGWTCIDDTRCQYNPADDDVTVTWYWYYYVFCVLGFIFWISLITFCIRRCCCQRTTAYAVTSQTVYAPINNQAHYQAYAPAPGYGQPVYGQPVVGCTTAVIQQV